MFGMRHFTISLRVEEVKDIEEEEEEKSTGHHHHHHHH